MAIVREKKDKDGNIRAYKVVVTLGRDDRNRKVYVSTTIQRPVGLTPKKEEKEIKRLVEEYEHEQRELYESNRKAMEEQANKKRIKVSVMWRT